MHTLQKRPHATMLSFLLPHRCVCKSIVLSPYALCSSCWSALDIIAFGCIKCGYPLSMSITEECGMCNGLVGKSAVYYNEMAQKIVTALKFGNRTYLARFMASMISKTCSAFLQDVDYIIPIPLPKGRLFKRGFNQSALIARHIMPKKPVIVDQLIKTKTTKPQTTCDQEERYLNVVNSFLLRDPLLFAKKTVLLVDDVMTTGSTIEEAVKQFKKSTKVKFVTFARSTIHTII